ncbi:hypothetical protein [Pseudoalteromonas umbrosa]|uniref:hypothetical protein n=1 Tax=Pseudoalteromonas umbrosa TaxID=3048489 RepID=UPI0024C22E55|nr:hypothetical protein [Pseudoalteromonas sp. B95]MDK1288498.1 hypothetical protein [Pseudoalteromonas sp. B95]
MSENESSIEKKWYRPSFSKIVNGVILIIPFIAIAITLYFIYIYSETFSPIFPELGEQASDVVRGEYGTFGDFFGGVLNPSLSFLTIVMLVFSLLLQTKELKATREELALSRKTHEEQTKEFTKQAGETSRFQTTHLANLQQQSNMMQIQSRIALDEEKANRQRELELQLIRMLGYQNTATANLLKSTGLEPLSEHERRKITRTIFQGTEEDVDFNTSLKLLAVMRVDEMYIRQVKLLNDFASRGLNQITVSFYCVEVISELLNAREQLGHFSFHNSADKMLATLAELELSMGIVENGTPEALELIRVFADRLQVSSSKKETEQ